MLARLKDETTLLADDVPSLSFLVYVSLVDRTCELRCAEAYGFICLFLVGRAKRVPA